MKAIINQIHNTLPKGFTLIELSIYMGIFSILLVVLMSIFTSILDVHLESQATSSVTQDANFILTRFSFDIRRADTIVTPAVTDPATTTSDLHLTSIAGDFSYQLTGDRLLITNNASGTVDQLNSVNTYVTNLSFTSLGSISPGTNTTVRIVLKMKSAVVRPGGNTQEEIFQTTVGTR